MSRTSVANATALLVAMGLAIFAGTGGGTRAPKSLPTTAMQPTPAAPIEKRTLPGGGMAIVDAGGHLVPLRRYQRIASASIAADRLLIDLAEPGRVLAVSSGSARGGFEAWRYAGKATVDGFGPLETILALKPDLLLLHVFGHDGRVEKLRAAGIEVFALGSLRGLSTLLPTAEIVGELLGDGARGRDFAQSFAARMKRVATPLADRPRRRAMYLGVIAGKLMGGSRGTSYHDVITAAGLVDAAAAAGYFDWPSYRIEEVAAIDPDVVVSKENMREAICAQAGLAALRFCQAPGLLLTLPENLIEDPGVGMLTAAERLFALAYPDLAP